MSSDWGRKPHWEGSVSFCERPLQPSRTGGSSLTKQGLCPQRRDGTDWRHFMWIYKSVCIQTLITKDMVVLMSQDSERVACCVDLACRFAGESSQPRMGPLCLLPRRILDPLCLSPNSSGHPLLLLSSRFIFGGAASSDAEVQTRTKVDGWQLSLCICSCSIVFLVFFGWRVG